MAGGLIKRIDEVSSQSLGDHIVRDELALLARARTLDPDALAMIHDMYYPQIFRYIGFRVDDRNAAEDLTSEVFTRLLSALRDKHAPQNTVRGWLYGVASHIVSDYYRKHYRTSQVELDESIASDDTGPAEAAENVLLREDLKRAMVELTDEQRHVIALRFGNEMPIREVARTMGKSEGSIKQLQARAVAALARKMKPGMVE